MEQKELIEKITQEVVARLQARDASAGVPPVEGTAASELAPYIDHTLLKPEATEEQVGRLCEEAAKHHFYSVCVNSSWAEYCARRLGGTGVKVCAVVGFPLGAMDSRAKAFEARTAIANGADEIDMVMNVGAMKAKNLKLVREDMLAVRRACRTGIVLKVILETCMLTDEEKVLACQIAKDVGARFREDLDGLQQGRGNRRGHCAHAQDGRPEDGRQGGRRCAQLRGRRSNDPRGGHPAGNQRGRATW